MKSRAIGIFFTLIFKKMNELFSQLGQFKEKNRGRIPSLSNAYRFIDEMLIFLFPIMEETERGGSMIEKFNNLKAQLVELLLSIGYTEVQSIELSDKFMNSLAKLYALLLEDAQALYDGDPAAKSIEEVILTYPGFISTAIYRISHELYLLEIPLIPRIFSEYAHRKTGIDIHPGATIGNRFCIDHGTGIVIGETAIIGNQVKIYQGVTIGALSVKKEDCKKQRHPTIGDEVTIYAGATILGGETTVGHHSLIGGNAWLVKSVEPYSKVIHNSQITVITNGKLQ